VVASGARVGVVATVFIAARVFANSRYTVVLAKATRVRDAGLARKRQGFSFIFHEVENGVFAATACHSFADLASVESMVSVIVARDGNTRLSLPQVSTVPAGVFSVCGFMLRLPQR
jgi:hypothetical protein